MLRCLCFNACEHSRHTSLHQAQEIFKKKLHIYFSSVCFMLCINYTIDREQKWQLSAMFILLKRDFKDKASI